VFRAVVTILFCFVVSALAQTQAVSPPAPIQRGAESSDAEQQTALPQAPPRSFVYQAQSREAIYDYQVNGPTVRYMVDELLKAVTGEPTVASAWNSLVKPTDIVGIKVCANAAPLFSTHPAVVSAIVAGLMESGLPAGNIIVWDREEQALKVAGYRTRGVGYRLMWSEGNYDAKEFITSPIAGQLIYGDLLFLGKQPAHLKEELDSDPKDKNRARHPARDNLSDRSHISRVLTQSVTKVINVPVLSDNVYCGLSGALFNMTVQNVDNWRRLAQPPESGDPSIPEAYADPRIGSKVVLHMMDGLVALYAGGPIGNTNYAVQYGTLYCSKDPVALDAIAVRKIDQWRLGSKLNPVSSSAKWLQTALLYGLGNSDPNRIEIRDVR
jgi:uncharacterized protein (DUF362 family)